MQTDIAPREDTHGDRFVIEIEGAAIRDGGIAGELINRHAARMRNVRGERRERHLKTELWEA
jgi:hypothetical protein